MRLLAPEVGAIGLADAARICRLLSVGDPDAYDRAAVHWLRRFLLEARGVTLSELMQAAAALDGLPDELTPGVLLAFCVHHGLGR